MLASTLYSLQKLKEFKTDVVDLGGPESLVDVVFSFDTTGSMAAVIDSVRTSLSETIDRLFLDVVGIKVGVMIHGDYCDSPDMFWILQPTQNLETLKAFIKFGPNTGGGDYDECYELVLKTAVNDLKWTADVKVLVMIGDATPHEKGYECSSISNDIDWTEQVQALKAKNITVFSCHAEPSLNKDSLPFYLEISKGTGGFYFPLDELSQFKNYMVAICMKAADGAENVKMLYERQLELEKLLVNVKDDKEKMSLLKESELIRNGITHSKTDGVFSRETSEASNHVRSIHRSVSHSTSYERELKVKNPKFFEKKGCSEFMSILNGEAPLEPVNPPEIRLETLAAVEPFDAVEVSVEAIEPSYLINQMKLFFKTNNPSKRHRFGL